MTAATPGSAELLASLLPFIRAGDVSKGEPSFWFADGAQEVLARLAAKPDEEGVREAFKPFSDFMAGSAFNKLPDEMKLTAGSSLAHRQLTVGDFKRLRSAIWPSTTGEPKRPAAKIRVNRTGIAPMPWIDAEEGDMS